MHLKLESKIHTLIASTFLLLFVGNFLLTEPLIHDESYATLPYYAESRGRGLWGEITKIFDVTMSDSGLSRTRPLGSLLSLIDAKLVMTINPVAPLYFRSLVQAFLMLGIVYFLIRYFRRRLPSELHTFAWPLGTYFAVSGVSLAASCSYFRPAKMFVTFLFAFVMSQWHRKKMKTPVFFVTAVFLSLATLVDEQAVFLLGVVCSFLMIADIRARKLSPWTKLTGVALLFYFFQMIWVTPWTNQLYLTGSLATSSSPPLLFPHFKVVLQLINALIFQLQMVFGNPKDGSSLFFILGMSGLAWSAKDFKSNAQTKPSEDALPLRVIPLGMLILLAMIYGMVTKHRPILWDDVQRNGYYFLPTALFLYLSALRLLDASKGFDSSARRIAISFSLLVFCLGGIYSQNHTRDFIWGKHLAPTRDDNKLIHEVVRGHFLSPEERAKITPGARQFTDYYLSRIYKNSN